MEKIEFEIKLHPSHGDKKTVTGVEYKGFGITTETKSHYKWGAVVLKSGLLTACAPTRKALIVKLDKILELVPEFQELDSKKQVESLEASLPKGVSVSVLSGWLIPKFDNTKTWDELLSDCADYSH